MCVFIFPLVCWWYKVRDLRLLGLLVDLVVGGLRLKGFPKANRKLKESLQLEVVWHMSSPRSLKIWRLNFVTCHNIYIYILQFLCAFCGPKFWCLANTIRVLRTFMCFWGSTLKKEVNATLSTLTELPKDHPLRKTLEQYKQRFEESLEEFRCSINMWINTFCVYTHVLCQTAHSSTYDWAVASGCLPFHPWPTWPTSRMSSLRQWLINKLFVHTCAVWTGINWRDVTAPIYVRSMLWSLWKHRRKLWYLRWRSAQSELEHGVRTLIPHSWPFLKSFAKTVQYSLR